MDRCEAEGCCGPDAKILGGEEEARSVRAGLRLLYESSPKASRDGSSLVGMATAFGKNRFFTVEDLHGDRSRAGHYEHTA